MIGRSREAEGAAKGTAHKICWRRACLFGHNGSMTRAELLAKLADLRPWLASQGVARVRLFGSYARDEAGPDSDVDLLIELSRPLGLAFFTLQEELSGRLGLRVEMFTAAELAGDIRMTADADAIDA